MHRSFSFKPAPGREPRYRLLVVRIHTADPRYDWEREVALFETDDEIATLAEAALQALPPERRARLIRDGAAMPDHAQVDGGGGATPRKVDL